MSTDKAMVTDATLAQEEQPVAYSFRLATAIQHHEDGSKEYCNFDKEPRLSLTPPCVPKGSIKDYTPLYARPPAKREAGENVDASILRERISRAIFDPGQTEGYKGERTLTDWQTDAVMRVLGHTPSADLEASHE